MSLGYRTPKFRDDFKISYRKVPAYLKFFMCLEQSSPPTSALVSNPHLPSFSLAGGPISVQSAIHVQGQRATPTFPTLSHYLTLLPSKLKSQCLARCVVTVPTSTHPTMGTAVKFVKVYFGYNLKNREVFWDW